ncbi:hypothetical protein P0D90_29210 [Pseudomonas sp. CBSPCBW29]|nr:hypothetical protein P0D90_29210 [Pseudomonas sp. CBSPCBW29]
MILLLSLRPFLARYLPVLMAGIYVAFVGGTATVSLAGSTYFRAVPLEVGARVEFGVCMALSVVITLSNFMVLYGRSKWVWALVVYFIVCLLTALPTIQFSPNKFIYAESLFWPLLGLLILNSRRHRESVESSSSFATGENGSGKYSAVDKGSFPAEKNQDVAINMWERACSRMRCISQPIYQLTDRIREQARSHIRLRSSILIGDLHGL